MGPVDYIICAVNLHDTNNVLINEMPYSAAQQVSNETQQILTWIVLQKPALSFAASVRHLI